jgi:DNA polymerase-3 subunit gamma/tau
VIAQAEKVEFEPAALRAIARSAEGSMRDALSLLDQAIAFGAGEVREPVVRSMLGAVDTEYVYRIAEALQAGDGRALLAEAETMAGRSIDFASALEELASLYHRVAVAQAVAGAAGAMDDADRVADFAARMAPEDVQLAYQICVQGRADLALAPDAATGFSMTLLRLLAFDPGQGTGSPGGGVARPAEIRRDVPSAAPRASAVEAPAVRPAPAPEAQAAPGPAGPLVALPEEPDGWPAFVASLKLTGMAAQLAAQTEFKGLAGNVLSLALPVAHKHLADRAYADKLKAALDQASGRKLLLAFEVGGAAETSLAAQEKRQRAEQQARAEAAFRDEPFVRDVLERFDARIRPDSIKPVS